MNGYQEQLCALSYMLMLTGSRGCCLQTGLQQKVIESNNLYLYIWYLSWSTFITIKFLLIPYFKTIGYTINGICSIYIIIGLHHCVYMLCYHWLCSLQPKQRLHQAAPSGCVGTPGRWWRWLWLQSELGNRSQRWKKLFHLDEEDRETQSMRWRCTVVASTMSSVQGKLLECVENPNLWLCQQLFNRYLSRSLCIVGLHLSRSGTS